MACQCQPLGLLQLFRSFWSNWVTNAQVKVFPFSSRIPILLPCTKQLWLTLGKQLKSTTTKENDSPFHFGRKKLNQEEVAVLFYVTPFGTLLLHVIQEAFHCIHVEISYQNYNSITYFLTSVHVSSLTDSYHTSYRNKDGAVTFLWLLFCYSNERNALYLLTICKYRYI